MARIKYYNPTTQQWEYADSNPLPTGQDGDILVNENGVWVAKKPSRLPAAYQEVEYIESTGTQYIDTGCKPNESIAIEAEFAVTSSSTNQGLYGGRGPYGAKQAVCLVSAENTEKLRFDYSTGIANVPNNFIYTGSVYDRTKFKNESTANAVNAYVNDVSQFSQSETFADFEGDYSISIFAVNTANTKGLFGSFRLYSFKVWKGETMLRNFVPVYNVNNGDIGLYDFVSGGFYGNAGTGTFLKGADV